MDENSFIQYRNFIAKADGFCAEITRKYSPHIRCRSGCSTCCCQNLSLLPVEFYFLREGLEKDSETQAKLHAKAPGSDVCILLADDLCLLYDRRPIICRTHGIPLLITGEKGSWRDCCPQNFTELLINDLPESDLLHLERLNTILIAVNNQFAQAHDLPPDKRIPLETILSILS